MKFLVIGSGGREHALAWKLSQSSKVSQVLVAPGNGGTAHPGGDGAPIANVAIPIAAENGFAAVVDLARKEAIDLVAVGPEAPLADGIVDALTAAGLRCFGPTRRAAQLEASKAFAKAFMALHRIPTGRYATFRSYEDARSYLDGVDYDVVVKASGLAAGKGVIVPESREEALQALHQIMVERAFGAAGDEVVIEERLYGQEASVLAFSDGVHVVPMPPAQDHKPVFDGDRGPNTGGMGAYAPAPLVTPELLDEVTHTILQPTVDGLREEGTPYVGVLYAGLMITAEGPRVLEFNCRFGDPETQVILPLLDADLVDVMEACLDGRLPDVELRWRPGAAVTVVAASGGYPGSYRKGLEIRGIEQAEQVPGVVVFHAGTKRLEDGRLVTDGGRVLNVTALGARLEEAIERAYQAIALIHFEGMHYRRDIGAKALKQGTPSG
ncbi:MAG: phosphoribosylamine--glycine ligase [Anaerolineae bacterium]